MEIDKWEEELHKTTFSETFDHVLSEYERGHTTIEEIESNIKDLHQTLMNGLHAGEKDFNYTSAMIDANQMVLAKININKSNK